MAEFNFYINDNERIEVISYILSKGSRIIPDNGYRSEHYRIIQTLSNFIEGANKGEHKYFLTDDSFTFESLLNNKNRFSENPLYSIEQRKGGPYIDLCFFSGYSEDAVIPYKRSWLDYYSRFMHYNSYEEYKVPEELKSYFKDLVRFIKTKCKLVEKNGNSFWISNEVLNEIPSVLQNF
jgi:hypothetical protein